LVTAVAGGEGKPVRKVQGTGAVLARGDVMLGVDRRGWNGGEQRRRRWSSTTVVVFQRDSSPVVDQRWGKSSREARRSE
jgi:hypothetical protein